MKFITEWLLVFFVFGTSSTLCMGADEENPPAIDRDYQVMTEGFEKASLVDKATELDALLSSENPTSFDILLSVQALELKLAYIESSCKVDYGIERLLAEGYTRAKTQATDKVTLSIANYLCFSFVYASRVVRAFGGEEGLVMPFVPRMHTSKEVFQKSLFAFYEILQTKVELSSSAKEFVAGQLGLVDRIRSIASVRTCAGPVPLTRAITVAWSKRTNLAALRQFVSHDWIAMQKAANNLRKQYR